MIPATWPYLAALISGLLVGAPGPDQTVTRLVVRDEVVWRVPLLPRNSPQQIVWVEKKGPKCVPIGAIRRALLSGTGNVDFVLGNRQRVRAKFDSNCPALDFYGGLYLVPDGEDEMLCAQRDVVHSRMGGSCEIDHFSMLHARIRG